MENMAMISTTFWRGKKVLVTGHTGFKGTWLTKMLVMLGANVTGLALPSPTVEGGEFFRHTVEKEINSVVADIRDLETLQKAFHDNAPEIVFHLAAQPIVAIGYADPVTTYSVNVMGTVNVLESARLSETVRSVINVTTDKVYENNEWVWGYRENDRLNGHDPYSNSKSCSELVTASFRKSFFTERDLAISTMRAGNVIGGGDFSPNRIIPDCVRAALKGESIKIRNATSMRPYQHVLEAIYAYIMVAEKQYGNNQLAGEYNVGPNDDDTLKTGELADMFCTAWSENLSWQDVAENSAKEANLLRLDCSKIKKVFYWRPYWNAQQAVEKCVEWAKVYARNGDIKQITEQQINNFLKGRGIYGTKGNA